MLGILFSLTMLMVSVALVMAVIVTNIFLRKDSGRRVPSSVRRVFLSTSATSSSTSAIVSPSTLVAKQHDSAAVKYRDNVDIDSLSILSELNQRVKYLDQRVEYRDTVDIDSLSILSELDQRVEYRDTVDIDGLSILSELDQQNSVVVSRRPVSTQRSNTGNSRRSTQQADSPTADNSVLYSREWQMLAKVVDRIFFWLFVSSSIGALGSMFASLPHKNLS